MDLSVVIVSFNTKDLLRQCLRAVFASRTKYSFEAFVVDNGSADGSADMVAAEFPKVALTRSKENLGYAKANNLAIRKAAGRYVLLLNSDVTIDVETFDKMLSFMDNNSTASVAGPRVARPDGSLDLACRRSFPSFSSALFRFTGLSFLFPKSRFAAYNLTYLPENEIAEVDSVMGAFLLIRADVVKKIGLLDEDYFMYGEDLDWCWRVKAAGGRVMYAPVTTVIHHKGSSSRRAPQTALYEFYRAMWIFYGKHYRRQHNFLVNFAVWAGIWTLYLLKAIANGFRREKFVSK